MQSKHRGSREFCDREFRRILIRLGMIDHLEKSQTDCFITYVL